MFQVSRDDTTPTSFWGLKFHCSLLKAIFMAIFWCWWFTSKCKRSWMGLHTNHNVWLSEPINHRWLSAIYEISEFTLHVIEERCERAEHSTGHGCKKEQLPVKQASNETSQDPPAVFALRWSSVRRSQRQCDRQSIRYRVNLHVDGQTIEYGCQCQVFGCGKR